MDDCGVWDSARGDVSARQRLRREPVTILSNLVKFTELEENERTRFCHALER